MNWINEANVLIVGLGLMGGSYAMGLRKLGFRVTAIDTNESSIIYAKENGIIDEGSTKASPDMINAADAVIFALYPTTFKKWIVENQKHFKSGIFITDVTGVKKDVVYEIQSVLRDDVEFIASHPMAGRETSGVEHSDNKMFIGANYIITPTDKNTAEGIKWCGELGRLLGVGNISVLSPEEHDEMIGFVSQLTHVIAVSLMTCSDNVHLKDYTGDSFRDLTRIANINDKMWSELFLMNKDILMKEIDVFVNEMNSIKQMLEDNDREGLREKMRLSTQRRSLFNKKG